MADVTAKARRSDALYYDGVNRHELCDMVAHLEADNADVCELCAVLWARASITMPPSMRQGYAERMAALGIRPRV